MRSVKVTLYGITRKGKVVGFRLFKEHAEEWVDSYGRDYDFVELGGYIKDGVIYLSNEYSLSEKYSDLVLHPLHVPDWIMERGKALRLNEEKVGCRGKPAYPTFGIVTKDIFEEGMWELPIGLKLI